MMVQNPDNFGNLHDYTELGAKLAENKMIFTICCDLLSVTITKPPG
jgi:glycine dehydrogenase